MRFFGWWMFCTSVLLLSYYCTSYEYCTITVILLYRTRPQTWSIVEGSVGWRQKSSKRRGFSLGSYLGVIGALVSSFWWSPNPAKQLQVLDYWYTTTVLLLCNYCTTTGLLLYYYCTTTVLLLYYYYSRKPDYSSQKFWSRGVRALLNRPPH